MTIPALVFSILVALLYGGIYHLVRNGGFWRLVLFCFLSLIGFALGYLVGVWRGWMLLPIGQINLGLCTIGSLILLFLGDWLTRGNEGQETKV